MTTERRGPGSSRAVGVHVRPPIAGEALRGHDVDKLRDAIRAQALLWAPRYRGDDPHLCRDHRQPALPLLPDGDVEDACGAKGASIFSQVVPVEGMTIGEAFRLAHDTARDWPCSHPWVFRSRWLASEPWRTNGGAR